MLYRWIYQHSQATYKAVYRARKKWRSFAESGQSQQSRERQDAEYLLISPTNCGRTWLRVMLGKAIQLHFQIQVDNLHHLYSFSEINPYIPRIKSSHERYQQFGNYEKKKVLLLVRDPRDAMVSRFFQLQSKGQVSEQISTYVTQASSFRGGYIKIYNDWVEGRKFAQDFLLVRYEDLRQNSEGQMRRVFDFLNIACSDAHISEAIEYASLKNMRKMERQGSEDVKTKVFRAKNNLDLDSYKVRKGEIGGYRKYLSEASVAMVDKIIAQELDASYGYL